MRSSLCPYQASLVHQPRSPIVPGRKTQCVRLSVACVCVCVYIGLASMQSIWYSDKTKGLRYDCEKGLSCARGEPLIKEIEGEQVCAGDGGRRGGVARPFATGIARVISLFLRGCSCLRGAHKVSRLCKHISFHSACLLDQIRLSVACLAFLCEYRQIRRRPFPYIYLLLSGTPSLKKDLSNKVNILIATPVWGPCGAPAAELGGRTVRCWGGWWHMLSMTAAGDGTCTATEVCSFWQKFANLAYLSILHSGSHQ